MSDERILEHQQRIVSNNCNSTYSRIILPTFKDIWDFKNKYNTKSAVDCLTQVSQVVNNSNASTVLKKYKQDGNKPSTAITVYTLQSFVYPEMNKALREDNTAVLKLFAPYIYQLIQGLNEEKNYHGTVYRGIQLPHDSISKYSKDTVFFWPGFTSSTQNKAVAVNWPGSNCLFEIKIPKRFSFSCANIDHLSVYKSEKEVLIQPYSCYRVISNQYSNQLKKYIIKLIIESTCYNLSGIWINNDTKHGVQNAGIYFIAQYGKNVFWFGKKDKANWDFANVGYGVVQSGDDNDDEKENDGKNDVLCIKWADLPIANDKYCGELKLKISNDYQGMNKIYDSNDVFWGDQWKKKSNIFLDNFQLDITNIKWKSSGLTGVWKGNYGGIYIISVMKVDNIQQICWIGYDPQMQWAHIAFGVIENNKHIKVTWGDLLIGIDRYNGTLECIVTSNDMIQMVKSTPNGIFLTKYIQKA